METISFTNSLSIFINSDKTRILWLIYQWYDISYTIASVRTFSLLNYNESTFAFATNNQIDEEIEA